MAVLQGVLENRVIGIIGLILGVILSICFIYLYVHKDGRDERGRGIFATASFFALLSFIFLVNFIASFVVLFPTLNSFMVARLMQIMFNIVLLVHVISTLVLRKLR